MLEKIPWRKHCNGWQVPAFVTGDSILMRFFTKSGQAPKNNAIRAVGRRHIMDSTFKMACCQSQVAFPELTLCPSEPYREEQLKIHGIASRFVKVHSGYILIWKCTNCLLPGKRSSSVSSGCQTLQCLQPSSFPRWCSPWRSWSAWSMSAWSNPSTSQLSSRRMNENIWDW